MNKFFIAIIILIILVTWEGYNSFMIYGTGMGIKNPIVCPIIECPVCAEIITSSKDDVFSYQNCRYETMCEFGGYCEACPKSWKEEYDLCRELRELEEAD